MSTGDGMEERFDRFAGRVSRVAGHATVSVAAVIVVVAWLVTGPIFGFSDTWQLLINTGTTVLTFLMVFVIQNSINRDAMAVHAKLDELLRVTKEARKALIGAQDLPERDIERLDGRAANGSDAHPAAS